MASTRRGSVRVPLVLTALLLGACATSEAPATSIRPDELAQRLESGNAPVILDVRSADEYAQGHIPGATNVPHGEIGARLDEIPASGSDELVVHCQSGRRAELAEASLREAGFTNVVLLDGHWAGWRQAGLPVE